ncbi:hypothetical protein [Actinopolyspora halophila]|uniref:hypothetical protein n=1 Tax=Actinopolyspora halophila TaxID=1850 RepID=UPI00036B12F5|nr:hypothetical protein [Actinopolyspora halophila]
MSENTLSAISALFDLGAHQEAYQAFRSWWAERSEAEVSAFAECAAILEKRPRAGLAKLRELYKRVQDEKVRAVIGDCGKAGANATRSEPEPDRAPRWDESTKYQAPGPVHRAMRRSAKRPPRVPDSFEPEYVTDYQDNRLGVSDEPTGENPPGYSLDYDKASVSPLRGRICVGCFVERPSVDIRRTADDGLCEECRDVGTSGVDTTRDTARARCDYYTRHYPPEGAKALMRADWRSSDEVDRATIERRAAALAQPAPQAIVPGPRASRTHRPQVRI